MMFYEKSGEFSLELSHTVLFLEMTTGLQCVREALYASFTQT